MHSQELEQSLMTLENLKVKIKNKVSSLMG